MPGLLQNIATAFEDLGPRQGATTAIDVSDIQKRLGLPALIPAVITGPSTAAATPAVAPTDFLGDHSSVKIVAFGPRPRSDLVEGRTTTAFPATSASAALLPVSSSACASKNMLTLLAK